ncbi:hypothetical protein ESO86_01070 [Agromyces binzhouensis]|uniref:AAA+ ATPase domain-containing protein n=1 Tax=Agromyces binzhouensis TaxID=1817495 RepID=A0A4Q2JZM7_9MICO|nr:hypothetical protein ESO86_01070 [Agromyces binzhouensis]
MAFGEAPFDAASTLGEIFRIAQQRSGNALREQLERMFTVDRSTLPKRYADWFALPWSRIYTLNIDDLDSAVQAAKKGADLNILSALTSSPGDERAGATTVVHLNGRLADYPRVTFDPPTYGSRTATPDAWYQQFIVDTVTRPTLYIGTVLDEPPIWHYLSQRGAKGGASETRPRSWLFTKNLPIARRELLAGFNINLIEAYEQEVYEAVVEPFRAQLLEVSAQRRRRARTGASTAANVADIIAENPKGESAFLMGSEPSWGDIHDGYAAEFEIDVELESRVLAKSDGAVVLHGPAGSGKSTSLMRLAAVLAARGNSVAWVDPGAAESIAQIETDIADLEPDYVFVDEVDRFARGARSLIERVAASGAVVVGASRTHRLNAIGLRNDLDADYVGTPPLTDRDAEALIEMLERANRLGALLSKSPAERIKAVTRRADRQLLVTLIEATSGRKFHDKVADECADLAGIQLSAYGVICATHAAENFGLSIDDLLMAVHGATNEGVSELKQLISDQLLLQVDGKLRARHRTIAESAVDHFRKEGQLATWLEMLLFMVAIKYDRSAQDAGPYKKLLVRFLNHRFLNDQLREPGDVRGVYGALEGVLAQEFHYWLQRGSYELDYGDLTLAETFLRQAEAIRPDDNLFETAWCHLLLKMSLNSARGVSARELAEEALRRLSALLDDPGTRTPHTYAVYLRYGSQWVQTGLLPSAEDLVLRRDLRSRITQANVRYRDNKLLREAIAEAERVIGR